MYKQYIVMRKDLGMRKGKIAAQAAHASVSAIFKTMDSIENFCWRINDNGLVEGRDDSFLSEWFNNSFVKICVYVNSKEELLDIANQLSQSNTIYSLIKDNGTTEFHGVPTYTCLATEPLEEESSPVVSILKSLPLY